MLSVIRGQCVEHLASCNQSESCEDELRLAVGGEKEEGLPSPPPTPPTVTSPPIPDAVGGAKSNREASSRSQYLAPSQLLLLLLIAHSLAGAPSFHAEGPLGRAADNLVLSAFQTGRVAPRIKALHATPLSQRG